jgi:hypothetical protein
MKPGTTVICIDDAFEPALLTRLQAAPVYGKTYIVRDLVPDPLRKRPTGVTLEGLENPRAWMPCKGGLVMMEYHFRKDRFIAVDAAEAEQWVSKNINIHQPSPELGN